MPMRRQLGFTLVEILVAVLVLAIGLLGLAKLQTFGLHSNHSANLRTQATLLAYDMTDRIRANHIGYEMGQYNNPSPGNHHCNGGSHLHDCTPGEMAEHDIWEWNDAISRTLPQSKGVVCQDATPDDGTDTDYQCDGSGNVLAIKIWWVDEFDSSGNPVIKRFVTTFQP